MIMAIHRDSLILLGAVKKLKAARTTRAMRQNGGAQISEFAAAIMLVIPVFMVIIYVAYEVSLYMYLKAGVDAAARTEARWLAINFNYLARQNGNSSSSYANWKNSRVRVANCVTTDAQFTNGTIDSLGNFVAAPPPVTSVSGCYSSVSGAGIVAVRVVYPGESGLPQWPNPPLQLFGASLTPNNYTVAGVCCADIEP